MSTTTLHDQTVRLFGVEFTIDIEVHWSRSLAPTHTHNGHGDPPTIEVDGFEVDEDEAFARWCTGYFQLPPTERDRTPLEHDDYWISQAIAEQVRELACKVAEHI